MIFLDIQTPNLSKTINLISSIMVSIESFKFVEVIRLKNLNLWSFHHNPAGQKYQNCVFFLICLDIQTHTS